MVQVSKFWIFVHLYSQYNQVFLLCGPKYYLLFIVIIYCREI